jgi:hypothetical protein
MEREPSQRRLRYRYNSQSARRKEIDSLKPMASLDGDHEFAPRKLLVWNEGPLVILSLLSRNGTVNFPMSRTAAGNLVSQLGKSLAQPAEQ